MARICLLFIILPLFSFGQDLTSIQLPKPVTTGGKPLMEALMDRQSNREFSAEKLDWQTISDLLWAANGYNRPQEKKRTAPSSHNYQEIDIYLAMENGLFLWDAEKNILQIIVNKDIRGLAGIQDFVKSAPLNLIYVANYARVKEGKTDYQEHASYANTGLIAENVYLYGASAGLNVIVRAYFDGDALGKAMNLKKEQQIILSQTIGKPLKK